MDIQLLVRVDNKPEKTVTINRDVIIGRSKTCQFRVLSNDVSREHCKLIVGDDTVAIRDLGSSNGTVVNGQTIAVGTEVRLNPGANVEVGPLKFVVQFQLQAPPKAASEVAPEKAAKAKPTVATTAASTKAKAPTASPSKTSTQAVAPAQKKVTKKPAPELAEPAFPFAPSVTAEQDDSPAWPDFLMGGSDDLAEGETIAFTKPYLGTTDAKEATAITAIQDKNPADEAVFDPADKPETAGAAAVPAAVDSVAADGDGPIFGEFSLGHDESEFSFDPESAVEATRANSPSATTTKPPEAQPGKLKSLFGLFSKGKKETPAPAASPAATSPPAAVPPAPNSSTDPGDDGLSDFLSGGGTSDPDDDDTPDWMKSLS